jgi:hypothetical protein
MKNAIAIMTEWKGITPIPSEVLKDLQIRDSGDTKHQTESQAGRRD